MGRTEPRLHKKSGEKVYYIGYYCRYIEHSRLISTLKERLRAAQKRLVEFNELFEVGKVSRGFSFVHLEKERLVEEEQQFKKQIEQVRELLIKHILPVFKKAHQSGEIRRRGDRKETEKESTSNVMGQLQRVLDGLTRIDEITPEHLKRWGDTFVFGGRRSMNTRRHHETSIKSFTAWLERTERLPSDPLRNFRRTHVPRNEEKRTRNGFTKDELVQIFRAARNGPVRLKFTGWQRELFYRFCIETGFRAAEAAAMKKQDFADDLTSVHIAPWFAKDGKAADQPLPEWFRNDLEKYLDTLQSGDWLWPRGWKQQDDGKWVKAGWIKDKGAGKMLKADAAAAGLEIGQEAKEKNGGRVLDFHAFRHNFGISLRGLPKDLQMRLLRVVSEPVWQRYAHPDDIQDLQERIAAVNSRERIV